MSQINTKIKTRDFESFAKWLLGAITGFAIVYGYVDDNEVTVTPFENGVDEPESGYIDGTFNYWKSYGVQCYFSVADPPNVVNNEFDAEFNENIQEFQIVQSLMDWAKEQNAIKNFPAVQNVEIKKVDVTSLTPNFDGIDDSEETKLARWTFFIKVHYYGVL